MKTISTDELLVILNEHREYLLSYGEKGKSAYLRGADLSHADLSGADLFHADFSRANLSGAYLRGAKNINIPMSCPEKGSFIGFKKVGKDLIVELQILEDSLRSSATGRKCRCSKAKVLSITNLDGSSSQVTSINSKYDESFIYTVGEIVEVKDFDTDRFNECAPGIHFFITRDEAANY